jgi:ADP-dependent NAD(P)H-hydrate dehydratase / NAD(P)H-hydrate epimerase
VLRAHTVEQVRAAEGDLLARLPEDALMLRAAHGLAHAVIDWLGRAYGARVLLLVGSGDNGGDALHAGAVLARRGCGVEAVLLAPERVHRSGLAAFLGAGGRVVDAADAAGAGRPDVVVDGIVGIGAAGGLRDAAVEALAQVAGVPVVAVDVPSGVDVDTGEVSDRHVTADLTITFGTHKVAHLVDPAAAACGAVELVELGLTLPDADVEALQVADVAALLPAPPPHAQKYSRGVVGVRAGSARYPGAAVLSVSGAGCGLAGMVRYDGSAGAQVLAAHPETVTGSGRVQAWVVGSGGGDEAVDALVRSWDDGVPVVADADALTGLDGPVPGPAVLTPHAGELARLLGVERAQVEAAPLRHARAAAQTYAAVVLVKGRRTLVAAPGGLVRVNTTGTPWLATAGAGDVLGGLIGALLAAGLDPLDAASVGAWLHGAAATLTSGGASGGGPLRASDLAGSVPAAVRAVRAMHPAAAHG